eukprot:m.81460 g.81460  ORF g.81460 m.81460 type:complete len:422 (-) comp12636_c1_seq1:142-1407(-)
MSCDKVEELAQRLLEDVHDFVVTSHCPRLPEPPSSLEFLREYVSQNRPCVIEQACVHWPAFTKWSPDYLIDTLEDRLLSVEITPTGRADAIARVPLKQPAHDGDVQAHTEDSDVRISDNAQPSHEEMQSQTFREVFALPHCEKLTMSQYLSLARKELKSNNVFYISHQNSSLTDEAELAPLLADTIPNPCFAKEAFGCDPDATNFWMGPEEATTSMHKDPYENIYFVLRGSKTFTLLHPASAPFLYETEYDTHKYVPRRCACDVHRDDTATADVQQGQQCSFTASTSTQASTTAKKWQPTPIQRATGPMSLVPVSKQDVEQGEASRRPWLAADPPWTEADFAKYPLLKHLKPVQVTVRAGEALYLPALWYHKVEQSGCEHGLAGQCVAVNSWYDMKYDVKYCMHSHADRLAACMVKKSSKN